MYLLLSLLLAGPIYVASYSTTAQSQSQPAIVQSLSTGVYRPATVIFEGHRARIRFNHGGRIVLELDNPVTTESEEIVGVDQNHNFGRSTWTQGLQKQDRQPPWRLGGQSPNPVPRLRANRAEAFSALRLLTGKGLAEGP